MSDNKIIHNYYIFLYAIVLINFMYGSIFSGFINDSSNGEPLAYTNVILLDKSDDIIYGSISDLEGYFIIPNVVPGEYNVRIMLIGYDTYNSKIIIDESNIRSNYDLNPEPIQTDEVKVSAERMRFEKRVDISRVNLTNRDIKRAPSFIESDIFRTIQLLPSVSASNDFNSALIVRGGSPDENLILVDGAEIYNPYHIGGVFSTFNSDMISDTEFLAGGFPAQYSSRLSSVLSITSRKGDSKNGKLKDTNLIKPYWDYSKGSGSVSILSSKLLVEGPLYNGSWMFSGRRTYFDKFLDTYYYAIEGNKSPNNYYFWDMQFKATTKITQNNHLTFSQFSGKDDLKINVGGENFPGIGFNWDWGNSMKSLSWKYIPNMNYFLETNLSNTNYTFNVDFDIAFITDSLEYEGELIDTSQSIDLSLNLYNVVEDVTLDQSINYIPSEKIKLKIGWQYKLLKLDYEEYFTGSQTTNIESTPNILSAYISCTWQLLPSLYINPGLRVSKYNRYDKDLTNPRFAIKYNPISDLALKFSWGTFSQFLYTINQENELLRIVDFWQPIPDKQKPQEVEHFIIGAEYWISEGNTFSVESYYKPYHHVYDLNPKVDNANIDSTLAVSGTGKAYGIELLYKLNINKISGWVSYAYSQINREIDLNSDGILWEEKEIYPAKYNKPHSFNTVLNYQYSPKYNIGLACVFGSGQTYTPIIGKVHQSSVYGTLANPYRNLGNIYGARNSSQYPPYFRLDVSFSRKTNLFGMDGLLKFQFINLTNYYNVLLYNWDHTASPSRVTAYSMFPIIFTFGWDFKF